MITTFLQKTVRRITTHGLSYWIGVVIITILGFSLNHYLDEENFQSIRSVKFWLYRMLDSPMRIGRVAETTVIEISDLEYDGILARRTPLKRDYLGVLVKNLCAANARVVALDVSFQGLPKGPGRTAISDYAGETDEFRNAIFDILKSPDGQHQSRNPFCRIVFAVRLDCGNTCRRPLQEIDAAQFSSSRVTEGAANFAADIREMPTRRPLENARPEDSFSWAIFRAYNDSYGYPTPDATALAFPYTEFLSENQFKKQNRVLPADSVYQSKCDEVRPGPECQKIERQVQGRVVLIGGTWHRYASSDELIDPHYTPIGLMSGVFVHANFVAAAIDGRLAYPVTSTTAMLIDILVVSAFAILMASIEKLTVRIVAMVSLVMVLLLVQYIAFHNFGYVVDCAIPVLLLICHYYVHENSDVWREKFRGWRVARVDKRGEKNGHSGEN